MLKLLFIYLYSSLSLLSAVVFGSSAWPILLAVVQSRGFWLVLEVGCGVGGCGFGDWVTPMGFMWVVVLILGWVGLL